MTRFYFSLLGFPKKRSNKEPMGQCSYAPKRILLIYEEIGLDSNSFLETDNQGFRGIIVGCNQRWNCLMNRPYSGGGNVPGNTGEAGNEGRPGIGIGGAFGLGIGNALD